MDVGYRRSIGLTKAIQFFSIPSIDWSEKSLIHQSDASNLLQSPSQNSKFLRGEGCLRNALKKSGWE